MRRFTKSDLVQRCQERAGEQGEQVSPDEWKRFIDEQYAELYDLARNAKMKWRPSDD